MSETRNEIIAMADELIRTKGYNAFSYADIAVPLQIKNAAIHYHFPSKADLGISVIETEIKKFGESRIKWAFLPEDEQFKMLIEKFSTSSVNGLICLMGSLSPDYDTLPATMKERVKEMSEDILTWLMECLEKGRRNNLLSFEGAATDRALTIMANLLSSLLFSRVMGKDIFPRIKQLLLTDLKIGN